MNLKEKLNYYRLNEEEYERIQTLLGRTPQGVEWALFSALWSEHCSYKSSRIHLKKLFSESDRLVQGFGENAGVIDLGQGEQVAFKMESHNHPSFIEPYQGAATGVGGILRDIFTMGARPIALGNYLAFGEPQASRMNYLIEGVVAGISGYGNCVGVPNITGQTEFHKSYNENILVNALALGYFGANDTLVTSSASGPGNYVVYVGAKTGRDGIHGASMASESFEEKNSNKQPTVQIGDPFYEKLLIESCIEVINQNLVVAIQDMGAAGLSSCSFEMASKGGVGLKLKLDAVPLRDSSLSPEDILLSESQERMLLICEPQKFKNIDSIFKRWNLEAQVIGEVTESKNIQLIWHNEVIADIDPDGLTKQSPEYDRDYDSSWVTCFEDSLSPYEFKDFFKNLFQSPVAASKNWIYNQYDQRVGAQTARGCDSSVGVVVLPESGRSLGVVLGCRPHMMRGSAYVGTLDAIYYPALELAIKGLEPLAVTDCLNFGNPENKNVMSDFVASIQAMNEACQSLKIPVISGNVSFYNETQGQNITPTPSTGLVGLGGSPEILPTDYFQSSGDLIYKLTLKSPLKSSGRMSEVFNKPVKFNGQLQPDQTASFVFSLLQLTQSFSPKSTRIVGNFGTFYTLFKMCTLQIGCVCYKNPRDLILEQLYEVLFVIDSKDQNRFEETLKKQSKILSFEFLGVTKQGEIMDFQGSKPESFSVSQMQSLSQQAWDLIFHNHSSTPLTV